MATGFLILSKNTVRIRLWAEFWIPAFILVLIISVSILVLQIFPKLKLRSHPGQTEERALSDLSAMVQDQLTELQTNSKLCDGPTILCGHHDLTCGLGCQIHHRMGCVALSYAMGVPLIHADTVGWPYRKPWKSAFSGPGSSCQPGNQTINVYWHLEKGPNLTRGSESVPFALQNGFVVPKDIGLAVEELVEDPFIWWIGQFVKFTTKLTKEQSKIVQDAKQSLGLDKSHPTVGIHVRRTDKITEYNDSRHPTNEYFHAAEALISKHKAAGDLQSIFVASDDHTVLPEARGSFPDKPIIGFHRKGTLHNPIERADFLDEAIQDLLILSEADFIVCGLTSNICRAQFELMCTRHADGPSRFKAMDGTYQYHIWPFMMPRTLNFV